MESQAYTVFEDGEIIASGGREAVVPVLRQLEAQQRSALVFDDFTGRQVDLDMREEAAGEPAESPEHRGPGRPRLGVVGREVTLLPRHWEWLNAQPGGASVALRKLVEHARRESAGADRTRSAQEAAFRFMTAVAGNESGFEEACRALYAGELAAFESRTAAWPPDVAAYARRLAAAAFEPCG